MRVAVYGGSFNPPHVAHAMVMSWLKWTDTVDEVWMVPVYQHAFESIQSKRLVDFEVRMHWCRLAAFEVGDFVRVTDIESTLPTPSYSIDTLLALQQQYPDHQFRLVVGADVVSQLPQWKDWATIEKQFAPIIVGRVGYSGHRAQMIFPNVSSTAIRTQVKEGRTPHEWLQKPIADWLAGHPRVFELDQSRRPQGNNS